MAECASSSPAPGVFRPSEVARTCQSSNLANTKVPADVTLPTIATTVSRFLALPTELRLHILDYVIFSTALKVTASNQPWDAAPLLFVCRSVHRDTLPTYLRHFRACYADIWHEAQRTQRLVDRADANMRNGVRRKPAYYSMVSWRKTSINKSGNRLREIGEVCGKIMAVIATWDKTENRAPSKMLELRQSASLNSGD